MKRLTFVGFLPCGHANYLAASPASLAVVFPDRTPEEKLEEWESLLDDLKFYIEKGRVEILDEEEVKTVDVNFSCGCAQP